MRTIRNRAHRVRASTPDGLPDLDAVLDRPGCRDALALFRSGLDNVDIAWRLECTPAAAARGIACAREEERRAPCNLEQGACHA